MGFSAVGEIWGQSEYAVWGQIYIFSFKLHKEKYLKNCDLISFVVYQLKVSLIRKTWHKR